MAVPGDCGSTSSSITGTVADCEVHKMLTEICFVIIALIIGNFVMRAFCDRIHCNYHRGARMYLIHNTRQIN